MENADDRLIKTLTSLEQLGEDVAAIKEVEESFDTRLSDLTEQVEALHNQLGEYSRQLDALSSLTAKIEAFESKFTSISSLLDKAMTTLNKELFDDVGKKMDELKASCDEVSEKISETLKPADKEKKSKNAGKGIKANLDSRGISKGKGKKKK